MAHHPTIKDSLIPRPADEPEPSPVEKVSKALSKIPARELAQYRHGRWADAVEMQTPTTVLSTIQLKDAFAALATGEPFSVSIIRKYSVDVIGDNHNSSNWNDPADFLIGEPGSQKMFLQVNEVEDELSLTVANVIPGRINNGHVPDPENWVLFGYVSGYYEYNYNAGGESFRNWYKIRCAKGVLSWKHIPDDGMKAMNLAFS
jgi:hypothetical protein